MKQGVARGRPHFDWDIRLPYPRTVKSWMMLLASIVGVVVLTAGLAQVFQVDFAPSSSSSTAEGVEAPDLD
jgi:hypothetical protein